MTASVVDGDIRLTTNGRTLDLPAIWLRDNCTDPGSRDATSGQRLFNIVDLPVDVRVRKARLSQGRLEVVFGPDGHRSDFDVDDLLAHDARAEFADARNEKAKRLWSLASDVASVRPTSWAGYLDDRAPALRAVVEVGFAVLSGVPAELGQVTAVAETFGYVRETNYGRIFDVRVEENAINLAYTGRAISPHTDNPYRDPVPTLQLLHCLHNAADGGESGLVDGFAAAAALRERDPEAYAVLTTTPVAYRFDGDGTRLSAVNPLIGLDASGHIREIRFNNRSMAVPRLDPGEARRFYAAYRTFAELLYAPESQLNFRMDAGDCLIFDNTRLLHARTAFAAAGGRHLQGTYADLDGLLSTMRTLEENR